MEENNYEILETVCATTSDNHHYLILQAKDNQTGDIVWAVGDSQVCAIASEDFVRNRKINYKDVCIQEFPYQMNTPESVGNWRPLIQELVEITLQKYMEYDGLVRLYPQWLPEDVNPGMGRELYQEWSKDIDHIILFANNTMEMVPRRDATMEMASPMI